MNMADYEVSIMLISCYHVHAPCVRMLNLCVYIMDTYLTVIFIYIYMYI